MSLEKIALPEVIRQLRTQLLEAMKAGEGEALRLAVKDIELELQVGVEKAGRVKGGAKGKLKFWVLGADVEGEVEGSLTTHRFQKLKLRLQPKLATDDGDDDELYLSAD